MKIRTEIVCVFLAAILAMQGWTLTTLIDLRDRVKRIETVLELKGLLASKDK